MRQGVSLLFFFGRFQGDGGSTSEKIDFKISFNVSSFLVPTKIDRFVVCIFPDLLALKNY